MIISVEEFVSLCVSNNPRDRHRIQIDRISEDILLRVLDEFPEMTEYVIQSNSVTIKILEKLAVSQNKHIKSMVARKRKLSVDLFEMLSKDEDPSIRYIIACNKQTPESIISCMLQDECDLVARKAQERLRVLQEQHDIRSNQFKEINTKITSVEEFVRLCWSENSDERYRVKTNQISENILLSVLDKYPELTECVIWSNSVTMKILEKLAVSQDKRIKRMVASKNKLSDTIFEILSKDEEPDIRYDVACRYSTPESIIYKLMQDEDDFVAQAARETFSKLRERRQDKVIKNQQS